jgi:voltage-gated potassium channel
MSNHPFKDDEPNHHFTWLDMMVIVLSVYVLGMLFVETFLPLPHEVKRLLLIIDDAICVIFLYDFVVRFRRAPNKWEFMKWGWIDLLSSIPTANALHAGRAFRLLRLIRILRAFRSMRHLIRHLYHSRVHGTFSSVLMIAVLLVIFSSIVILEVETAPNSNIRTAEDAIWWSYVTITTIGYGDYYPVTTAGRIVAMVLMTAGVGLFGTFTAYVAAWFAQGDLRLTVKNPIRNEEEDEHRKEHHAEHKEHAKP